MMDTCEGRRPRILLPGPSFMPKIQHLTEATALLRRAHALQPDDALAAEVLARALLLEGRIDEAEVPLQRAWEKEPLPSLACGLGLAELQRGNAAKAREWARRALDQSSWFPRGHLLLAAAALADEAWQEVGEHLSELAALCPDDQRHGLRMGALAVQRAARNSGERQEALNEARRLLLPLPESRERGALLAVVLLELGQPAAAIAVLPSDDDSTCAALAVCAQEHLEAEGSVGGEALALSGDLVRTALRIDGTEFLPRSGEVAKVAVAHGSGRKRRAQPEAPSTPNFGLDVGRYGDPQWRIETAHKHHAVARQRLEQGSHRVAGATLCRAFDALEGPGPDAEGADDLRIDILRELLSIADEGGITPALAERSAQAARMLALRSPGLLDRILSHVLSSEETVTDRTIELLIAVCETDHPLPRSRREAMDRILAPRLRVRFGRPDPILDRKRVWLERIHAVRPSSTYVRQYLARALVLKDDLRGACQLLEGIQGPLRSSPRVLNLLGSCAEALGDEAKAENSWRASLAADPEQPQTALRLGRLLLERAMKERPEGAGSGQSQAAPAPERSEGASAS